MKNTSVLIVLIAVTHNLMAQLDFEHLKNQPYLKNYYKNLYDCNNIPDSLYSNLSLRICANIKLQHSDSVLSLYNDSLRTAIIKWENENLLSSYDSLQASWRKYRDEQAKTVWRTYEGCGGCHLRAIHYMTLLRQLTEVRITELKSLLQIYRDDSF